MKKPAPSETVRIATVIATGRRYVVNQIDFRAAPQPRVHCHGEVIGYKGTAFKFGAPVAFNKSEVEIKEVARTQKLVCDLYSEMLEARRAAGHIIVGSGHNKRDLGTLEQIAARKAAVDEFNASFAQQILESEKEGLGLLGLIKMMADEKRLERPPIPAPYRQEKEKRS